MMKKAVINIPLVNDPDVILNTMKMEPFMNTRVKMSRKGKGIELSISVRDTSTLRAAINAHLRWLHLSKKIAEFCRR